MFYFLIFYYQIVDILSSSKCKIFRFSSDNVHFFHVMQELTDIKVLF
jgi:hypothetical protein